MSEIRKMSFDAFPLLLLSLLSSFSTLAFGAAAVPANCPDGQKTMADWQSSCSLKGKKDTKFVYSINKADLDDSGGAKNAKGEKCFLKLSDNYCIKESNLTDDSTEGHEGCLYYGIQYSLSKGDGSLKQWNYNEFSDWVDVKSVELTSHRPGAEQCEKMKRTKISYLVPRQDPSKSAVSTSGWGQADSFSSMGAFNSKVLDTFRIMYAQSCFRLARNSNFFMNGITNKTKAAVRSGFSEKKPDDFLNSQCDKKGANAASRAIGKDDVYPEVDAMACDQADAQSRHSCMGARVALKGADTAYTMATGIIDMTAQNQMQANQMKTQASSPTGSLATGYLQTANVYDAAAQASENKATAALVAASAAGAAVGWGAADLIALGVKSRKAVKEKKGIATDETISDAEMTAAVNEVADKQSSVQGAKAQVGAQMVASTAKAGEYMMAWFMNKEAAKANRKLADQYRQFAGEIPVNPFTMPSLPPAPLWNPNPVAGAGTRSGATVFTDPSNGTQQGAGGDNSTAGPSNANLPMGLGAPGGTAGGPNGPSFGVQNTPASQYGSMGGDSGGGGLGLSNQLGQQPKNDGPPIDPSAFMPKGDRELSAAAGSYEGKGGTGKSSSGDDSTQVADVANPLAEFLPGAKADGRRDIASSVDEEGALHGANENIFEVISKTYSRKDKELGLSQ